MRSHRTSHLHDYQISKYINRNSVAPESAVVASKSAVVGIGKADVFLGISGAVVMMVSGGAAVMMVSGGAVVMMVSGGQVEKLLAA